MTSKAHAANPSYWRNRAANMRALTSWMENAETKAVMVKLAEDYDKLADRAEARANTGEAARRRNKRTG